MSLPRDSGLQTDLKPGSVRQFLNVPAEIVHKDDRMAGGQGVPTRAKTGCRSGLCELFGKNIGGRHQLQYRAIKPADTPRTP
jgi:hypothetical protein